MRIFATLVALSVMVTWTAHAREPQPASVEPSLHRLLSSGDLRFLEYRICSPEHCWSSAFLQWLDAGPNGQYVLKTARIRELQYGTGVESASWDLSDDAALLVVRVVPSHGGFEPYTLMIKPGSPGQYATMRQ